VEVEEIFQKSGAIIKGHFLLASVLEGYLIRVGRLGLWARPLLIASGFLIAFPEWRTTIIGAALTVLIVATVVMTKRRAVVKLPTSSQ